MKPQRSKEVLDHSRNDRNESETTALLASSSYTSYDESSTPTFAGMESDTASSSASGTATPRHPTPLPWRLMIVLWALISAQSMAFEQIFPFVNQMILEIGVVNDPKQVGYYSGLIESIFAFMNFLAVLPLSFLSDRLGRKPVVLVGMAGMAISVSLFGLSKSFIAMIITRCFGGFLGGSYTAIKVIMAESTDKTNQGAALSGLTIAYRVGQVVGHPLGGFLAHPERHWSVFQTPFWTEYPFVLPGLVASTFTIIAIILGVFWVEETLPSKRRVSNHQSSTYGAISAAGEEAAVLESAAAVATVTSVSQSSESQTRRHPWRGILTPSIVILLVSNALMVYLSEVTFSVYPLYAFTPIEFGGLGLDEAEIGTQLAIRSFICIAMVVIYDPLYRWMGTVRVYQLSMITWPITIIFYPILNILARNGYGGSVLSNSTLLIFFMFWGIGGFAWIGGSVMLNDLAPSADALATLNGIFQMFVTLPQALAPASATYMFALSIKSDFVGGNAIWIALFSIACIASVQALMLKEAAHDWRQDCRNNTAD